MIYTCIGPRKNIDIVLFSKKMISTHLYVAVGHLTKRYRRLVPTCYAAVRPVAERLLLQRCPLANESVFLLFAATTATLIAVEVFNIR